MWIAIANCTPPHQPVDEYKVIRMMKSISTIGWKVPLKGYWTGNEVQLLSGSHRYEAAKRLNTCAIPVQLFKEQIIKELWGTDLWIKVIQNEN